MGRSLRIAVWYHFGTGGAKRALEDHLRGLQSLGHHLEIWHPPFGQTCAKLAVDAPLHEVSLGSGAPTSKNPLTRKWQAMDFATRLAEAADDHAFRVAQEIQKGSFDVLFANTDVTFHAPHLGRHLPQMPRVLYLQEPNRPFYEASPRLPWLLPKERGLRAFARDFLENRRIRVMTTTECDNAAHYEATLVNSRFSRESVLRTYGLEASVCYLGIDPGIFRNLHLDREPFVMSVGSLIPAKNPAFSIRSLATIPKEERPPLVWPYNFGDAGFVAELEKLAKDLGVDFRPKRMVPDDELVSLLNKATAFLYAPRLEPFGLAPLEANACGTPVVAVAEGGVRETVVPDVNGILVDLDPAAMGEGVRSLLRDPDRIKRIGETGEEWVRQEWTVEKAALRVESHLISAIDRKGGKTDG